MASLTIGLVGRVSAGKSTLVNALLREMVSPVAMTRSTFRPILYENNVVAALARQSITSRDESIKTALKNGSVNADLAAILAEPLPVFAKNLPIGIRIMDFAGIADGITVAKTDPFLEIVRSNFDKLDVIFFIAPAASLMVSAEEVTAFKTVQNMVAANKGTGRHQEIFIVATKYDDDSDDEVDEVVRDAEQLVGTCRALKVSALKMFKCLGGVATNSSEPWIPREMKKTERFGGRKLSDHEKMLLSIPTPTFILEFEQRRHKTVAAYISSPHKVIPIARICEIVPTGPKNTTFMVALAIAVKDLPIGVQYLYMRALGMRLGFRPLDCLSFLQDSPLKCFVYAVNNDGAALARHLREPWTLNGNIIITSELNKVLPSQMRSMVIMTVTVGKIIEDITCEVCDTATSTVVIQFITDPVLRAYFKLCAVTYERAMVEIMYDGGTAYAGVVAAAGVNWPEFKRAVLEGYYIDGRRGPMAAVVCESYKCVAAQRG